MVCADALRVFLRRTGVSCIKQMTVKTAFGTGEVMVVLESESKEIRDIDELIGKFDAAVYSLSPAALEEGVAYETGEEPLEADDFEPAVLYSLESVAVIHKGKCRIIAGKPTITEKVTRSDGKELSYEISPQSFYQVNPEQMPKLYDKAMEYAALTGKETLLDLYCGVGTIGIWMADKAEKVIGIESVKPAVIDANRNSVINNIINTRYICGKAEEELPGMMGLAKLWKWNEVNERVERKPEITIEHADVAVLDPPRAGCEEVLLEAVVKAAPDRIVYVSCDPGTLARDIKYLSANGYEFIECTTVDQFPWTSHIEVVAKIQRR